MLQVQHLEHGGSQCRGLDWRITVKERSMSTEQDNKLAATLMIEDLQEDAYAVQTLEAALKVRGNQALIDALVDAGRYLSDFDTHDQDQVDRLVYRILKAVG